MELCCSSKKVVGLLHVVLGLEDFGEVAEQQTLTAIDTTQVICLFSIVLQ